MASPGSPQPPTANLWVCLPEGPVVLFISLLTWVNVIVLDVFYDLFLFFRAGQTLRLISRVWAPGLPADRCLVTSARTLRRSQTSNHATHPASSLSSKAMTRASLKRWPHMLNAFHMWQVSKECSLFNKHFHAKRANPSSSLLKPHWNYALVCFFKNKSYWPHSWTLVYVPEDGPHSLISDLELLWCGWCVCGRTRSTWSYFSFSCKSDSESVQYNSSV